MSGRASGGYTGSKDGRTVAGVVHAGSVFYNHEAIRRMGGADALRRLMNLTKKQTGEEAE